MPWSVTAISTIVASARAATTTRVLARASRRRRCRPGCATRGDELLLVAAAPRGRRSPPTASSMPLGLRPSMRVAVDRLGDDRVDVDRLPARASGSSPCSRDSSMISWTSRSAGSPRAASGRRTAATASGSSAASSDRLGEQRQRADRGLQLVADVGDEVAADRLDPARARCGPRRGPARARLPSGRDPRRARRRGAGRAGPAGQLELGLADHAVAAHLPGQVGAARRGPARRRGPGRARRAARAGLDAPRRPRRRRPRWSAAPRARRRRRRGSGGLRRRALGAAAARRAAPRRRRTAPMSRPTQPRRAAAASVAVHELSVRRRRRAVPAAPAARPERRSPDCSPGRARPVHPAVHGAVREPRPAAAAPTRPEDMP